MLLVSCAISRSSQEWTQNLRFIWWKPSSVNNYNINDGIRSVARWHKNGAAEWRRLQCLIIIYSRWATRNTARWNQPIMKLLWVLFSMGLLLSATTKGILFFLSLYQRYSCAKTHSVRSSLSKLTELRYVYWSFDKMSYYHPDYKSRVKSTKCLLQITCS